MTLQQLRLVRILEQHGIEFMIYDGDTLYAADSYTDKHHNPCVDWVDISDWTADELYEWLGY